MRVLHLDAGKEMRGGQWQVLRLMEGLAREGVEPVVLAREGAPLFTRASERGWRVEALGFPAAARLARRSDVVHAHDARSHTIAAVAGGAPLVVARRVAFPIGGSGILSRWKYRRAGRYVAVSEFVKAILVEGGVPEEKVAVVYDGVPLLKDGGPPTSPPFAVAPANAHDPRKGAALAMEAARLAGVELRLSAELESDLPHASLMVYVTQSEGLGSGALLAMSAGVPVVASNVGGLREVIRTGENGLLVENDAGAVAAAIRQVMDSPEFARRIGQQARQTVIEKFTVERMVRRTMEVYRQVLS